MDMKGARLGTGALGGLMLRGMRCRCAERLLDASVRAFSVGLLERPLIVRH